jgi:hypothetical protein
MLTQIVKGALLQRAIAFGMRHKMLGIAGLAFLAYRNRHRFSQHRRAKTSHLTPDTSPSNPSSTH